MAITRLGTYGQLKGTGYKLPCRLATTESVTLSGPPPTVDEIMTLVGDRILVWNQSSAAENGIYIVGESSWTRAIDFSIDDDVINGMQVYVNEGATHSSKIFTLDNTGVIILGTTLLVFNPISLQGGVQGPQGFQGASGSNGTIGVDGATGPQGFQGFQGRQGFLGPQGFQGRQGPVGFQGFQGPQGRQGFQGPQGVSGNAATAANTFQYTYSTNITASDPGSGYLRFDSTNLSTASQMYIDSFDGSSVDLTAFYTSFSNYGNSTSKGVFKIQDKSNSDTYALYTVNSISLSAGYYVLDLTHLGGSTTSFADGLKTLISFTFSGLDGSGTAFTYQKTIFVDPNGDNDTFSPGRIDRPCSNVYRALSFLENDSLSGWTVWVFPGAYEESDPWIFNSQNNTTVKLNGGVAIEFNLKGASEYAILGNSNFSIIGDDRSITGGLPNVSITSKTASEEFDPPQNLIVIATKNKQCRISNIALLGAENRYAITLSNADNQILHITNSYIYSTRNNIRLVETTDVPRVAITNSILVNGDKSSTTLYANIITNENHTIDPGMEYFNGIWNFENVRFVIESIDNKEGTITFNQKGFISSDNMDSTIGGMYVTFSSCKFFCSYYKALPGIWADEGNAGINFLEIIGTSLHTSDANYWTGGVTWTEFGNISLIIQAPIIDPTLINI